MEWKNFSLSPSIVVVKSELKIKMKKMRYDEQQQQWKQQKLSRIAGSVPFNGGGKDDCLSGQGVSDCVCLPLLFR